MTSHPVADLGDLTPESPAQVLACLDQARVQVDAGEVEMVRMAHAWAVMHPPESITPGPAKWTQQPVFPAGDGAPGVAEFCIAELAAVLGVSTETGSELVGDALELVHRLPRLWAAVCAGRVKVWRARQVARATKPLSPAAAAFVDAQVSWVAGGVGPAALQRVVEAALAKFDPAALERARQRAAEHRRFDVDLEHAGPDGTVEITGHLDLADAQDLDDALARRARHLGDLGSQECLDVRRARAAGELARADLALDLVVEHPDGTTHTTPARKVVVHVHLADAAVARVERGRHVVGVEQVRGWCQAAGTSVVVKPVIDLAGEQHVEAHEIPTRIRDQVLLRDLTCVFPWCGRPSRTHTDLDHTHSWEAGQDPPWGTTPFNLAPLCRHHHRVKTHSGWTYQRTGPTTYEWTSPHGRMFTVTAASPDQHDQHRAPDPTGITRPGHRHARAGPSTPSPGLDEATRQGLRLLDQRTRHRRSSREAGHGRAMLLCLVKGVRGGPEAALIEQFAAGAGDDGVGVGSGVGVHTDDVSVVACNGV